MVWRENRSGFQANVAIRNAVACQIKANQRSKPVGVFGLLQQQVNNVH